MDLTGLLEGPYYSVYVSLQLDAILACIIQYNIRPWEYIDLAGLEHADMKDMKLHDGAFP